MSIIADTGFWLALANRRDVYHERSKIVLAQIQEPLVTTWPVITETCHLLMSRLGHHALESFIRSAGAGAMEIFDLGATHLPRIHDLMVKYRDLPMDLADASLLILAEHLGSGRILTTDQRDFATYRWKNRAPFENVLLLSMT